MSETLLNCKMFEFHGCPGGGRDPSRAGAVGEGEEPSYQRAEEDKQRGQLSVSVLGNPAEGSCLLTVKTWLWMSVSIIFHSGHLVEPMNENKIYV